MRETILWSDVLALRVAFACLSPSEIGAVMRLAMHLAEHGQIDGRDIRKAIGLRGRQSLPDQHFTKELFIVEGDLWRLNPGVFQVKYRGSERERVNLSAAIRLAIHERDKYLCAYCGTGEGPFEVDHVVPVSRGGGDDHDNLCLACKPCNRAKSNKLVSEWQA